MLGKAMDIVSLLSVGGLWGGMLFFAAVFAPLVFLRLAPDVAGRFIRAVFPVYYLTMALTSGVAAAALGLGPGRAAADAVAMALVCLGFVLARQILMPSINHARDRHLREEDGAGRRFERLHRLSVLLNGLQLTVVGVVLVRLAW